ncbi:MAG: molybdopterin-guanine dinucleotide biosynthesis protein B [Clostridiales Family XIII bacterium]|jgi:molybdopterin-guanine dinucleotide biosynthesis protein B|nr:molybdopterin-guanine dinucleotide biosynthesis protein B [Clostridiales Family XIII bacterium]
MNHAAVIAVCGRKNSGKTTLIEALIPKLAARGVKVAVVKHHGHAFDPDVPGTDTWRFYQAGAVGTVISDDRCYMLSRRAETGAGDLVALFPDADLVLLEGYRDAGYPKIELDGLSYPDPDAVLGTLLRMMQEGRAETP